MENFLDYISQAVFSEHATDQEKMINWPSAEAAVDKISDTNSTVRPPIDVNIRDLKRFNSPAVGVKRKRKIVRHSKLNANSNVNMQAGKNFDAFANDES